MATGIPGHENVPLRHSRIPFGILQSTTPLLSSECMVSRETTASRPTFSTVGQTITSLCSYKETPDVGPVLSGIVTGNPGHGNVPSGPSGISLAVPQSTIPFAASKPNISQETTALKPAFSTAGMTTISHETPGTKPVHLVPSSCPTHMEQTALYPQLKPSTASAAPITSCTQELQVSWRPSHHPPQSRNSVPSGTNAAPPSISTLISTRGPNFQPSFTQVQPTYIASTALMQSRISMSPTKQTNAVIRSEFESSSVASCANDVGYAPTGRTPSGPFIASRGLFVSPPPIAAPIRAYSGNQIPQPEYVPLIKPAQGIIQDFGSLSLGSTPGSADLGLDFKTVPRPLMEDVKEHTSNEMFPMNCNSRYLRLTTYAMPNSQSLLSRWHLPLGAVICPLAEDPDGEEVPIVNSSTAGIVLCVKCQTFLNPYVTFVDGGQKWQCNICAFLNNVPAACFSYFDSSGKTLDLAQRPEMQYGSVEFISPPDEVWSQVPPVYLFLIDVSINAVRSGMLEVVSHTIRSCLDRLAGCSRAQIGLITFDSTIHFYNLKSSLPQPQLLVVSDVDDLFVPLPDGLLVNLSESRSLVDTLLDGLPTIFQDTIIADSAFGPAVKAAFLVMGQIGGKLLIFQNTLPSVGVGCLRLRTDDPYIYGTVKEHALRLPQDPFYEKMAVDFKKQNCTIDVYAFSDKYIDIASLGTLARYTGGQVYYYRSFQYTYQKEKLRDELIRNLTRETAWKALLRTRCGRGMHFTTLQGNMRLDADVISLTNIACDQAYALQLHLKETLLPMQNLYFQVACQYFSSTGERRIRVHNAAVPVVADVGEMYRRADIGAIVYLFCLLGSHLSSLPLPLPHPVKILRIKIYQCVSCLFSYNISRWNMSKVEFWSLLTEIHAANEKTLSQKLEEVRIFVQQQIVKALQECQNLVAVQHRLAGRMIYPESLKYLPLYGLALCKSIPLRGGYGDVQLDERCAGGYYMQGLPIKRLLKLLYPNLFRIDEYLSDALEEIDDFSKICKSLPLSEESLDTKGLYIYDDGFRFIIWFGRMLMMGITSNLLGEEFATDYSKASIFGRDNDMSRKLISILGRLREEDPSYHQPLVLVRQGEQPREGTLLLANLVEDQFHGLTGLADWVTQIYQQVLQKF